MSTTTTTEETSVVAEATNDPNKLPLSEPVFQILDEIFDGYDPEDSSTPPSNNMEIEYIPEHRFPRKHSMKYDLNNFLESYPYDSWDSPGSVEENCLFPELSF